MYKAIIWSGSLALLVLAYHFEAIAGRWQFDRLCEQEGGSKFEASYRKHVAHQTWELLSADPSEHRIFLSLNNAAWVRFRNSSGELIDAHLQSAPKLFQLQPADESKPVQLRLSVKHELLADNSHIRRVRYVVTDADQGQALAQHVSFAYAWSATDRILLSPPISLSCHGNSENLSAFLGAITQGLQVAMRP
jgi:hypothetical protein